MIRRLTSILGLCLALVAAAAVAPPAATGTSSLRFVTIGTGGATSTYRAVGEAICALLVENGGAALAAGGSPEVAERDVRFRCSAPSTGGSTYNINQLAFRAFNFGLAQSDWQHHAFHGTDPYHVRAYPGLRAVFSIHPEPFHVVVGKDSGIERFEDLKGKRVNIGNPGSGQRGTTEVLMQAYGMELGDFAKVSEYTSVEQTRALCENKIDAFTLAGNLPNPQIALATNRCGARVIPLDTEIEKQLVAKQPYYVFFTVPKGTYETMDADVTTFGVRATLVTRSTASEKTVYALVRSVMENIDAFRQKNSALRDLNQEEMITQGLSAPLHPGALRYYKERGWK